MKIKVFPIKILPKLAEIAVKKDRFGVKKTRKTTNRKNSILKRILMTNIIVG